MQNTVQYNPECYLIQPSTGAIHIVSKDDPLRKRADMRTPTQAEVDAHYARIKAILSGKPVPVVAPVEKPAAKVTTFEEAPEVQEAIAFAKKRRPRAKPAPEVVAPDIDSELDDVV